MKLSTNILKQLVKSATNIHSDEIGCDDCFDRLNKFAELKLKGKSPEEAMPLVQEHLQRCPECREEYEALMEALQTFKESS